MHKIVPIFIAVALMATSGTALAQLDPLLSEKTNAAAKLCADDVEKKIDLATVASGSGFQFDNKLLGFRWSDRTGGIMIKKSVLSCQLIMVGIKDRAGLIDHIRTWAQRNGYREGESRDAIFSAHSSSGKSLELFSSNNVTTFRISFGY